MPQYFVKSIDGTVRTFEALQTDTIKEFKKKIEEKTGESWEYQKLMWQGSTLEDDKTIEQCNFSDKGIIYLSLRSSLSITAKFADGTSLSLKITYNQSIMDLKQLIENKVGVAVKNQILMIQNDVVKDECNAVSEFNSRHTDIMSVVVRSIKINVFVKTADFKTIYLEIKDDETILSLKDEVEKKFGLKSDYHELWLDDVLLDDKETISKYDITSDMVIIVRSSKKIITVRTADGVKFPLCVLRTDRGIDIKANIEKTKGILSNDQLLLYNKTILQNDDRVDLENVRQDACISVIPQRSEIEISIVAMDGRKCSIAMDRTGRIMDLKHKIENKLGIAPSKQTLISIDRMLEDENTFLEYGIDHGSVIYLID